jgi:hypothetical protein
MKPDQISILFSRVFDFEIESHFQIFIITSIQNIQFSNTGYVSAYHCLDTCIQAFISVFNLLSLKSTKLWQLLRSDINSINIIKIIITPCLLFHLIYYIRRQRYSAFRRYSLFYNPIVRLIRFYLGITHNTLR